MNKTYLLLQCPFLVLSSALPQQPELTDAALIMVQPQTGCVAAAAHQPGLETHSVGNPEDLWGGSLQGVIVFMLHSAAQSSQTHPAGYLCQKLFVSNDLNCHLVLPLLMSLPKPA